jgi:tetratricopeptide (TPR) repeat protein
VYFVMDSCYSGLALTRAAGAFSRDQSYLEEVTRRSARQILTAGGAEQQVADDGPNGHSVFTWALLQGLDGKADLDANGVITASELGAYVSPVVTSFSRQTPAVGNLPGSEGGEFIFELQPQSLSAATEQLEGKALDLNARLAALERQIQERQTELLRLQQSIQAETAKLQAAGKGAEVGVLSRASGRSAYELDRMALRAYREKNYAEAEKLLLEAVRLKPRDATLLNNLGFVYYRMGRYEAALDYLKKTLALEPRRKEAHGNIADTYAKLGRLAEARGHYTEYLALYPSSPRADEVRRTVAALHAGSGAVQ